MSKAIMRLAAFTAAALIALGLISGPAMADAPGYEIDKPHCSITFKVRHIFVMVPGKFRDFSGDIRFNPGDLAASRIHIAIRVSSLDTGVDQRDEHLESPDFFDAAKYPEIKFVSSNITHLGGDEYLAQGKLTVRGVSKDFALPFKFLGEKPDPMNPKRLVAGFEAAFPIDRLEYGVGDGKFYKMGVVGKDVMVNVDFELARKP